MIYLYTLVAVILIWNLLPVIYVLFMDGVPFKIKLLAARSFLFSAFPKGLLVFIPDLLAPVIVPIALLFTKREDNHLPALFTWWDNDVSINGDRPEYSDPSYEGVTYYADAHPRSFWARFVWLGWRNRASKLSKILGYKKKPGQEPREHYGDSRTNRDHEGTVLYRAGNTFQFYFVKRIFGSHCIRVNYGHKVWDVTNVDPIGLVVNISFSVLRWKGN